MPRWMCGWGCTAAKLSSASRGNMFLTFQHISLTWQSVRTFTQLKCCVELVLLLNSSNMRATLAQKMTPTPSSKFCLAPSNMRESMWIMLSFNGLHNHTCSWIVFQVKIKTFYMHSDINHDFFPQSNVLFIYFRRLTAALRFICKMIWEICRHW